MMIDLQNKIIILDEAHNIEDSAREAASLSITSDELTQVTDEIEEICESLDNVTSVVKYGFQNRM